MTTETHPNVALIMRLDPRNLPAAADLFAEDFVWHYVNPHLPDIQGDYAGVDGLRTFFEKLAALSKGSFRVNPVSATPFGDELVVTHVRNTMTLEDGEPIAIDAVVVWRIVDGRLAEAWDIPSVHTLAKAG